MAAHCDLTDRGNTKEEEKLSILSSFGDHVSLSPVTDLRVIVMKHWKDYTCSRVRDDDPSSPTDDDLSEDDDKDDEGPD